MTPQRSEGILAVAYSGHRRLADDGRTASAVERVFDRLELFAAGEHRTVVGIGSAAIGADTLFLESLKRRGHPNLLKMPFSEDRFEATSSSEQRERCLRLIAASPAVAYAPAGLSESEAYLESGLQTIEDADVLIVVWDGEPARGQGGTAEIARAAETIDLLMVRIDPSTGEVHWPVGSALGSAEDAGTTSAATEAQRHATADAVLDRTWIEKTFQAFDEESIRHAPKARLLLFRIIVLHLIAAAVAIGAVMAELHGVLSYAVAVFKVVALVWALVLTTVQRKLHSVWLDSRYAAELCRSFLAAWPVRRDSLPMLPSIAVNKNAQRLRRDLEIIWRLNAPDATDLDEAREHYLQTRLRDQRTWLEAKGHRSEMLVHRIHIIGVGTTVLAIACAIVAGILGIVQATGGWYASMKALSIILPLAAASVFTLALSHDLTRRAARYVELAERLKVLEKRIQISGTWPSFGRVVAETEALLLDELGEWHAMTRFAGRSH